MSAGPLPKHLRRRVVHSPERRSWGVENNSFNAGRVNFEVPVCWRRFEVEIWRSQASSRNKWASIRFLGSSAYRIYFLKIS